MIKRLAENQREKEEMATHVRVFGEVSQVSNGVKDVVVSRPLRNNRLEGERAVLGPTDVLVRLDVDTFLKAPHRVKRAFGEACGRKVAKRAPHLHRPLRKRCRVVDDII